MRTLILVRHAKSSWEQPALADHDRPLNPRGRRAARKMGRRLARAGTQPDLLLSSSAIRALKTARLLARQLNYRRRDIIVEPGLYACRLSALLQAVRAVASRYRCVMLVGHNPEITQLARRFSSRIPSMPTAAVACFTFDSKSWTGIGPAAVKRVEFDFPRRR